MNIFKKIKTVNKVTKTIKTVKIYLDSSHVDEELKEIIVSLKADIEKLIKKIPEAKTLIDDILSLIK